MTYAPIERDLYIDATPDVVYDVVSSPEHIRQWWGCEVRFAVRPGAEGELVWNDEATGACDVALVTVVETQRPRLFSFRWDYEAGQTPVAGNSMLVEFTITAEGSGSRLRMVETGLDEIDWDAERKRFFSESHHEGWDRHLPDLRAHAERVATGATGPVEPVAAGGTGHGTR